MQRRPNFYLTLLLALTVGSFSGVAADSDPAVAAERDLERSDGGHPDSSSQPDVGPQPELQALLNSNCIDCHDGAAGEGGFDLAILNGQLDDPHVVERWTRVYDRINAGEMPPPDDVELDDQQRQSFLELAKQHIGGNQKQRFDRLGRVRGRRLSNRQIELSLCDLLAIKIELAELAPEPVRVSGFHGIASAQQTSHFQLQSHLRMVDAALDEARNRLLDRTSLDIDLPPKKIARDPKRVRGREAELVNGAAVAWKTSLPFHARIPNSEVEQTGWYDIELEASGLNVPSRTEDGGNSIWCSIRSGECTSSAPLLYWIDEFAVTEKPKTFRFRGYLRAGHMLELSPLDVRLKRGKFSGGQIENGVGEKQDIPGLAMHRLSIKQIFPGGNASDVAANLLGELDHEIDVQKRTIHLEEADPIAATSAQLRRFAARAFRMPDPDLVGIEKYESFLSDLILQGEDPVEALWTTYRALLCSPRFLYFQEQPGALDDIAYANRLAYFLTGSFPDERLMADAVAGRLSDDKLVVQHIDRILTGQTLDHFVRDFVGGWLDLVNIDSTDPDPKLYRRFDKLVEHEIVRETELFVSGLLGNDRPVAELINAEHTYLNSHLADYYEIEGIESFEWKRADVSDYPERGGLLGQASILKVTANGNDTSPVLRGVWLAERVLGCEVPPPPSNIPAIEPDIRGATTVREQLFKHLADPSCAACHQHIDPPGYALENFDAAGNWRENYPQLVKGKLRRGAKIDPSFEMADGTRFESFEEFKQIVASDPEALARNFAAKLTAYGTGQTIQFADRDELTRIVDRTKNSQYGMRSLLDAVATSELFRRK